MARRPDLTPTVLRLPAVTFVAVIWLAGAGSAAHASHMPGQAPEGLPDSILQELRSRRRVPAGRYSPTGEWFASELTSHETGARVADAAARHGAAWQAVANRDVANRALSYGPYADLPPGDYVAFFRIMPLDDAGDERVATIDTVVDYGKTALAGADLTGADLVTGRYTEVPLAFHDPGGRLECRVFWSGYATLRMDSVALFRLTGGSIRTAIARAPAAVLSGHPNNLVYRGGPPSERSPFPRSLPPAKTLIVVDLRNRTPDWQLLLLSLQGLVNRRRPRIYCLYNPSDEQWLHRMLTRGWVRTVSRVDQPGILLSQFSGDYHGVIVTDPALPATTNVATMLAGIRGALIASPRLEKTLRLPVVADLRGRWRASVQAYQWAFEHLWPALSHQLIACLFPDYLGLRDYLVENRVFTFWISGPLDGARPYANPTAEGRLMEALLARIPVNLPVLGYPWAGQDVGIGEGPGVTLFSEFGHYLVGSIDVTNLSVHSGIRAGPLHQRPARPAPKLGARVYVCWVISDGDNLPVLTTSNYAQLWSQPERGRFPLGWTISPSAGVLIPDVVEYYYSTATRDDEFLAAVSGIGYAYPDVYGARYRLPDRARVFDGFLSLTSEADRRMDLRDAWIMGVTRPDLIARYPDRIPFLDALFPDYGRRETTYADATYPTNRNAPVFHAVTSWSDNTPRDTQIERLVEQIRAMTPHTRPAFLNLFVLNWFADLGMLDEVMRRLGPAYMVVRPDALAALYRAHLRQKHLFVQAPDEVIRLPGRPIQAAIRVRNTAATPMTLRAAVTGDGSEQHVEPRDVRLAVAEAAHIRIAGQAAASVIRIRLSWSGGSRTIGIPVRAITTDEIVGRLPAGPLAFASDYPAVSLAHLSGAATTDHGEPVWLARPQQDAAGHIAFGPYASMPAGDYVAVYRLKALSAGAGFAVTVDTCVGGGVPVLAARPVTNSELPIGAWKYVALAFHHPGGQLETRVYWPGQARVELAGVTLFRRLLAANGRAKRPRHE